MAWVVSTGDPQEAAEFAADCARPLRSSSLDGRPLTTTTTRAAKKLWPQKQPTSQSQSTVTPWRLGRHSAPNPRAGSAAGAGQRAELSAWLDKMMLRRPADDGGSKSQHLQNKGTAGGEDGGQGWQVAHSGLEVVRVLRRVGFAPDSEANAGGGGHVVGCGDSGGRGGANNSSDFRNGAGDDGNRFSEDGLGVWQEQLRLQKGDGIAI